MSKETTNAHLVPASQPDDTTVEKLRNLFERAQRGDPETRPVLPKVFQNPTAVELFGGNLARLAEQSLVEAFAGKKLTIKEAVTRKLELLREELAGPNPTPLERPPLKLLAPPADAPADPKAAKPFAHPKYWAAFVLIGDPD